MSRRLEIVRHLDPAEIGRRYRSCRHAREKTHWLVLRRLTGPDAPPPESVAREVGYSATWVRSLIKRWNAQGPEGLTDRRRVTNGGKWRLSPEQQAQLFEALQREPPDGGLWSGPKLALYVRDRYGVSLCKQTGWAYLRRLGFSLQRPRPRHRRAASAEERQAWKSRSDPPRRGPPPPAPRQGRRGLGRG